MFSWLFIFLLSASGNRRSSCPAAWHSRSYRNIKIFVLLINSFVISSSCPASSSDLTALSAWRSFLERAWKSMIVISKIKSKQGVLVFWKAKDTDWGKEWRKW
ncbi:uncharacterized protein G2W53_011326 [Senna tora]|uniref:Uncharacterized protein n=1 Tax=Senna tora TaxID=362788 RepID=A0A834X1A9_9FABA|nr:uncharacterized protein G2W53_011326 [Senna tora]